MARCATAGASSPAAVMAPTFVILMPGAYSRVSTLGLLRSGETRRGKGAQRGGPGEGGREGRAVGTSAKGPGESGGARRMLLELSTLRQEQEREQGEGP